MKTTKLWINDKLELRHYPPGWPKQPIKIDFFEYCHPTGNKTVYVGGDNGYEKAVEKYESALAKAKAESITLEDQNEARKLVYANKDKNGISILTSMYADTFVEINSSVELFVYGLGDVILSSGQDGKSSVWVDWAGGRTNVQRCDIIARLKPVEKTAFTHGSWIRIDPEKDKIFNILTTHLKDKGVENYLLNRIVDDIMNPSDSGANSFTEGMSDPGVKHYYDETNSMEDTFGNDNPSLSGFTQEQAETVRKFMIMARDDARRGLKDRILNQLRNQWVKDYGALDHITSDINAYFMVGFMNKVLEELKIK